MRRFITDAFVSRFFNEAAGIAKKLWENGTRSKYASGELMYQLRDIENLVAKGDMRRAKSAADYAAFQAKQLLNDLSRGSINPEELKAVKILANRLNEIKISLM